MGLCHTQHHTRRRLSAKSLQCRHLRIDVHNRLILSPVTCSQSHSLHWPSEPNVTAGFTNGARAFLVRACFAGLATKLLNRI